jgi:hypothetical protein
MDDITALHTAARRYCQQRFSDWSQNYKDLQAKEKWQITDSFALGWQYSEDAYRIFPRYRVDAAIQMEVERLMPDCDASLEALRTRLSCACDVAEIRLRTELTNSIAREALRQEADDFRAYISILNGSDLRSIEPLPYRRVIDDVESKQFWHQLQRVWGIGSGHWFPLKQCPVPPNVFAFHDDYFDKIDGVALLQNALQAHGIRKVFQLHEFGPPEPEYEIDLSIFVPTYGSGGEQYSTSGLSDWVVYASHESSVTICGDWLTRNIEMKLPDWSQHTYRGPYPTEDLRGTWDTNEIRP